MFYTYCLSFMKKVLLTIIVSLFITCGTVMAQSQAFKYQAVARGSNGALLVNTQLGVRLSILAGSATGTVEYQETQTSTFITESIHQN